MQNPVNHQNFERILRFRDIPGSMCVSVSAHTPLTPPAGRLDSSESTALASGRWSLGVAGVLCIRAHDTGIPRRVDLRTKRVVWCLNLSRQVWIVRRGCGKSVTRHHRQRDASFFCLWARHEAIRQDLERGRGSSTLETPLHLTEAPSSSDTQCPPRHLPLDLMHTRGPAEFKHIIKRRKRN